MKKLLISTLFLGFAISAQANDLPKECLEFIKVSSDTVMNDSIERAKLATKQEGKEFTESQKQILENALKVRVEKYKQEQTNMISNFMKEADEKEVAKICKENLEQFLKYWSGS